MQRCLSSEEWIYRQEYDHLTGEEETNNYKLDILAISNKKNVTSTLPLYFSVSAHDRNLEAESLKTRLKQLFTSIVLTSPLPSPSLPLLSHLSAPLVLLHYPLSSCVSLKQLFTLV